MKTIYFLLIISLAAIITAQLNSCKSQDQPNTKYEIESGHDSVYIYHDGQLINTVHRDKATLYTIDSIILKDNE